jgi:SAM-dependent methyltransferase
MMPRSRVGVGASVFDDKLLGITRQASLSDEFRRDFDWRWRHCQAAEVGLGALASAQGGLRGYCTCCLAPTLFAVPQIAGGAPAALPDWRESLVCAGCGMISRYRFCATELLRHIDPGQATVYLTEQVTPFYAWLRGRVPGLIGSEYLPAIEERAPIQNYLDEVHGKDRCVLRHEDVTALTLGDATCDAVVSLEVLEHVPDYRRALREFARILKPGGLAIFSAPFGMLTERTLVRATVDAAGNITHLTEPEYHGDPAHGQGCLCFYHFGWDLMDEIRAAGFATAEVLDSWEPAYGFLGGMAVFVGRRSTA